MGPRSPNLTLEGDYVSSEQAATSSGTDDGLGGSLDSLEQLAGLHGTRDWGVPRQADLQGMESGGMVTETLTDSIETKMTE